jgi:pimeloyl-ACP methyl ester carboxylesterase
MPTISNIYFTEFIGNKTSLVPLILLHGAGSNHLTWPAAIRRMLGFNVLALDLPGHGNSKGTGFHDIKSYSKIILDFLAAVGYNRAFFVGHSMGAAIALQMALDHPENTAGLGLIAGAASFQLDAEFVELFRSPASFTLGLQTLKELIAPQKGNHDWFLTFQQACAKTRSSLWYADWRACSSFDIRKNLAGINTPTLVMAGTKDKLVPYAASKYLANCLPNGEMLPCYNNGHILMLEEPETISQNLISFLNKISQDILS